MLFIMRILFIIMIFIFEENKTKVLALGTGDKMSQKRLQSRRCIYFGLKNGKTRENIALVEWQSNPHIETAAETDLLCTFYQRTVTKQ